MGPTASAATRLSRLPTHFGIGLTAEPDASGIYGWMPRTKIAWDYAYTYLAGGVNTGSGWRTWNSNSQYPLLYAKGAAQHGYIPVFPYYMLLQSDGPCGSCEEAPKDLAHLNSPSVMRAYFMNFATLMKRLGPRTYGGVRGFGRTAIVHVEPDLSGYAQQAALASSHCFSHCTGRGNDPQLLRAAVARSGYPGVAGYANNYRGFNLALLHLRDRYAPNVLLAFHVSDWATLQDIGSSTDPNLHPRTLGLRAGRFAGLAGVTDTPVGTSPYDVVFNDVADRDAGYYKHVYGRDVFWDRRNVAFPNFHRWETYLGAVTERTGRPAMVWQIPEGNQYFRSENNTDGHFQDNRAEYFFHHIGELKRVGVIALLFGRGNGGSTTHTDDQHDGVTNPATLCTHDGLSSGRICNGHTSTHPDDDGGYLRIRARAYYRAPVPVSP